MIIHTKNFYIRVLEFLYDNFDSEFSLNDIALGLGGQLDSETINRALLKASIEGLTESNNSRKIDNQPINTYWITFFYFSIDISQSSEGSKTAYYYTELQY
jgi:hypothetical protein